MNKLSELFTFPQPLLKTFPLWWIIPVLLLIGADLVTKKLATDNLRFYLTPAQFSQHQPLEQAEIERLRNSKPHVNVLGSNGDLMKFRLVFNDRFAFSLGTNQRLFWILTSLFAIVFLFFYRAHSPDLGYPVAWLAIFSGALGNLIDKLFVKSLSTGEWVFSLTAKRGYVTGVVDFLECVWFDWQWAGDACLNLPIIGKTCPVAFLSWPTWPTFNIADSLVSCGIVALLISMRLFSSPARSE